MSIAAMIRETLRVHSERTAVTYGRIKLTFGDLLEKSTFWHRFLDQARIQEGERIALVLENSTNLIVVHCGNLLSGRVTVPMNPSHTPGEMARVLKDNNPKLVVVSKSAKDKVLQAVGLAKIKPFVLDESLIRSSLSGGSRSPKEQSVTITHDMPAMIVYTSGTTGLPKGAVLTQGNLAAAASALNECWQLSQQDHLLLTLPLFHVHGLGVGVHSMLTTGLSIELHKKFDAAQVIQMLGNEQQGFTLFFGVPTYYHRLLANTKDNLSFAHLRLCVCGSAPLSADLHQKFQERFGAIILERYGMSETMMNLSNSLTKERHPGYVGLPLPGVEVKLVDSHGKEVETGEEGEILLRGPNVTPGYWKNPEATKNAFDDQGWFRSGDLGRFDEQREAYQITGRKKELIISGGMNIHPQEVENVITQYCEVSEVGVAGRNDPDFGEIVAAYVVGAPKLTLEDLAAVCREHLSPYKIPKLLFHLTKLPRNDLGKIQRSRLKEVSE